MQAFPQPYQPISFCRSLCLQIQRQWPSLADCIYISTDPKGNACYAGYAILCSHVSLFVELSHIAGELHVTPVHGMLQMRPSFEYLDRHSTAPKHGATKDDGNEILQRLVKQAQSMACSLAV